MTETTSPRPTVALDTDIALREMAKHAHRALNAAAAVLATVDEDIVGDQRVSDVEKRCSDIACSLFTLLGGHQEVDHGASAFDTAPLPLVATEPTPAAALPALADSIGRLRDSIAWLRDGKPRARGIGVADMVVIEAALANHARLGGAVAVPELTNEESTSYADWMKFDDHEPRSTQEKPSTLGRTIHHLNQRLAAKNIELRVLRGMVSGGLGADIEDLAATPPAVQAGASEPVWTAEQAAAIHAKGAEMYAKFNPAAKVGTSGASAEVERLAEALREVLSLVARNAPDLSGKVIGNAKAVLATLSSPAQKVGAEDAVASLRIKTWPTGKEYGLEGLEAVMNLPDGGYLLYVATPTELKAEDADAQATKRTPADFALEHAEYLAKDAERLVEAIGEEFTTRQRLEEDNDQDRDSDITAMNVDHDAAVERMSEAIRGVQSGVYEFRKRRDRAAAAAPATPAPAPVPAGFWLAPTKPDEKMKRAGLAERHDDLADSIWRAMRDSWMSRHPQHAAVTHGSSHG